MENPASWNKTQKLIAEAIHEHTIDMNSGIIGFSQIIYIYRKLKENNLLKEEYNAEN